MDVLAGDLEWSDLRLVVTVARLDRPRRQHVDDDVENKSSEADEQQHEE